MPLHSHHDYPALGSILFCHLPCFHGDLSLGFNVCIHSHHHPSFFSVYPLLFRLSAFYACRFLCLIVVSLSFAFFLHRRHHHYHHHLHYCITLVCVFGRKCPSVGLKDDNQPTKKYGLASAKAFRVHSGNTYGRWLRIFRFYKIWKLFISNDSGHALVEYREL